MITSLMTPYNLTRTIQIVEGALPGWWWSISQKQGEVFFNTGPGRKCLREEDNAYALTKEGDSGSSVLITRDSVKLAEDTVRDGSLRQDNDVKSKIYTLIKSLNAIRKIDSDDVQLHEKVSGTTYRSQSLTDLDLLNKAYDKLINQDLSVFEITGYKVEEVYLGSCDLSTDCSLRGINADGAAFDISVDLQGDGTIAESMTGCVEELSCEIMTYLLKKDKP